MTQSKKASLAEAIVNTCVGFVVTLICSPFIYWLADVEIKASQLGITTLLFTVLSIARGYVIRRWFNNLMIKAIKKISHDKSAGNS